MWNRLSKREKIFLSGLLGAAVIFCFYYYIFNPQVKAYAQVKTRLSEERAKLSRAQNTAASLTREAALLEKAKDEYREKGKLFATEMRDGSDIILLGFKTLASDVVIIEIVPAAVKENSHSLELPLNLIVEGDYLKTLDFCTDLEKLLKGISDLNLAEIRGLRIEKINPESHMGSSGLVRTNVEFVIYSSKDPRARLQLESVSRWLTGRHNIFREAAVIAPVQELEKHLACSPGNSANPEDPGGAPPEDVNLTPAEEDRDYLPLKDNGRPDSPGREQDGLEPEYILKK
ncbi:MAG: General secretion pathway, M protein [Firmicutes bacterium ADurb.Bin456]|nr:MAG: General secretion pathway, M protein [Firmicutes bacterium ADurb.Bin456]